MQSTRACPICAKQLSACAAAESATFPFCSTRCKSRDLGAWFSGSYSIAGEPVEAVEAKDQMNRDRV